MLFERFVNICSADSTRFVVDVLDQSIKKLKRQVGYYPTCLFLLKYKTVHPKERVFAFMQALSMNSLFPIPISGLSQLGLFLIPKTPFCINQIAKNERISSKCNRCCYQYMYNRLKAYTRYRERSASVCVDSIVGMNIVVFSYVLIRMKITSFVAIFITKLPLVSLYSRV